MKVFIVEDNPDVNYALKCAVEGLGFEVTGSATNTEDALMDIEEQQPDVCIADLKIGGGTTGLDLARMIGTRFGTLSVIITGDVYSFNDIRESGQVILLKPFTTDTLSEVLSRKARRIADRCPA
jgi:DNA-binding NarL/FixJ family response regulator